MAISAPARHHVRAPASVKTRVNRACASMRTGDYAYALDAAVDRVSRGNPSKCRWTDVCRVIECDANRLDRLSTSADVEPRVRGTGSGGPLAREVRGARLR